MASPNPHKSTNHNLLGDHPFIWMNIGLLAGVPWLLALSMAGLAVGDPIFPAWFEICLLGFPAIALSVWLQWQQPIFPFSLWILAKSPESLGARELQILTLIKQKRNGWYMTGWVAIALSIVMGVIFCKIYLTAPLAAAIAPFPDSLRLFGILWAEICFLVSNILLQAGISALRIKLTPESELSGLQPFTVEKINNNFTNIGWRSPQILKFFEQEAIADIPETKEESSLEISSDESLEKITNVGTIEIVETIEAVEKNEPEVILVIDDTITDAKLEASAIDEVEIIVDPNLKDDDQAEEEIDYLDQLEISEIIAEESLIGIVSASEIEIIVEEPEIAEPETLIEIIEEIEIVEETEIIEPKNLVEIIEEIEIIEPETLIEIIEEIEVVEELEIIEPETLIEIIEEIEIIVEEPEIIETENLVEIIEEIEIIEPETLIEIIEEIEVIVEEPEIAEPENLVEIVEKLEIIVEISEPIVDEPNIIEVQIEAIATKAPSQEKKTIDFLKKSRKTGGANKKHGFGKSVKQDQVVVPSLEIIEPLPIEIDEPIAPFVISEEIVTENITPENITPENITPENIIPENIAVANITEQAPKDPKYLVQEFLVDKFLARLEELNNADKK
jgi:hypothetical protein